MIIEKHNAHGLELVAALSPMEALALARKLVETAERALNDKTRLYYVSTHCLFEDDNNRWEDCDFDVVVSILPHNSPTVECLPTYPCGEPVTRTMENTCNLQIGHTGPCCKR